MSKENLTWVVAKIQMVVDSYPTWGDIVQSNTWKAAYGKNGVCCNLTFSDCKTGEILVRASSFWVMMNKNTRKISRFPNVFRAKLEQYLPRWIDLDINQHVNHVKYIGFILESVPKNIMETYEIDSMSLEYYKECTKDCVLQSFTSILVNEMSI
ncbi:hypothetical protein LXL04_002597 [Taraxacum kok-saghyz]